LRDFGICDDIASQQKKVGKAGIDYCGGGGIKPTLPIVNNLPVSQELQDRIV
jgi:hypothetical protein